MSASFAEDIFQHEAGGAGSDSKNFGGSGQFQVLQEEIRQSALGWCQAMQCGENRAA